MTADGWKNKLYFGDNLVILREHIATESVDLVYLDPPFNSNATYNVLFAEKSGDKSTAQITAFDDTWHWGSEAESTFYDLTKTAPPRLVDLMRALRSFLGQSDMMAYLTMMAPRLQELHRTLKPTGSLYLHCDPTASHYLKLLLDIIFGVQNYRNEITWKRTTAHNDPGRYGRNTDILFFYTKGPSWTWNEIRLSHAPEYLARFRFEDPDGRKWMDDNLTAKGLSGGGYTYEYKGARSLWRVPIATMRRLDEENRLHFTNKGGIRLKRYLDENKGPVLQALWDDIPPINSQAKERLGYPTQKPVSLLERIVSVSSNEDDLILDPFCGCGTTIEAAEALKRRWIGVDITHLAIALMKSRLRDAFGGGLAPYEIHGVPADLAGARALAEQVDRYDFEWWALGLIDARPAHDKRKGADTGVDGVIYFQDDPSLTPKKAIVQVKSGKVNVPQIRDLKGVIEREKAVIGLFLTLQPPTRPMQIEAASAGFYEPEYFKTKHPRIQILTIEELLTGKQPSIPRMARQLTFKRAERRLKGTPQAGLWEEDR